LEYTANQNLRLEVSAVGVHHDIAGVPKLDDRRRGVFDGLSFDACSPDKINNVIAPDGGAHVCAPKQEGVNKGVLFCVVLPPDS
jgi:hypothetical protein